jgi:hypothetical protein
MGSLTAALAIIPSLPRPVLDRLTQRMIERLDALDDADGYEPNNDEMDGNGSEDDFMLHAANWIGHPGCPISDPGEDEHDQELVDEREPEPWPGGGDIRHEGWRASASA